MKDVTDFDGVLTSRKRKSKSHPQTTIPNFITQSTERRQNKKIRKNGKSGRRKKHPFDNCYKISLYWIPTRWSFKWRWRSQSCGIGLKLEKCNHKYKYMTYFIFFWCFVRNFRSICSDTNWLINKCLICEQHVRQLIYLSKKIGYWRSRSWWICIGKFNWILYFSR